MGMTKQPDMLTNQTRGSDTAGFRGIIRAMGKNRILIALTLSYIIAGKIISLLYAVPFDTLTPLNLLQMLGAILPVFLVSMIVWRFAHMLFLIGPEKPIKWLLKDLLNILLWDKDRISGGAIAIICIILITGTFTFIKATIPIINPFAWDETFASIDRLIHGGVDPYTLLTPIFANPIMTKLADSSYSIWFSLFSFFTFIAAMDKENPIRRNRYIFAFFLCWILGGSVLATIFSSVGPVYYEVFGYGAQFAPLLTILHDMNAVQPILAVELQAALLDGYYNGGDLTGISAMPSMHLAIAWLMVFQAFRYSKILGWLMVGFAFTIQSASVYLAWHYAIDGYFGLVLALICWKVALPLARLQARFDRRAAQ
jgi:hypothetical protein